MLLLDEDLKVRQCLERRCERWRFEVVAGVDNAKRQTEGAPSDQPGGALRDKVQRPQRQDLPRDAQNDLARRKDSRNSLSPIPGDPFFLPTRQCSNLAGP